MLLQIFLLVLFLAILAFGGYHYFLFVENIRKTLLRHEEELNALRNNKRTSK